MIYEFDWDAAKAAGNFAKHGVSFEEAMAVFADPLALSRPDTDHSIGEERWITIGQGSDLKLAVVVHTFLEYDPNRAAVRIISARRPTKREQRQYEEEG
jgi:uncharacterized protein